MSAASKLGYKPGIPELMTPEKAEAVAVLIPSLNTPLYREIASGINSYLNLKNYHTFIIDTEGDANKENLFFETYKKYGISGIIHIASNNNLKDNFYDHIIKSKLPFVSICQPSTDVKASAVLPDIYQGFAKAINYIGSLGAKSAALILEDETKPIDAQLKLSFEDAVDSSVNPNLDTVTYFIERDSSDFPKEISEIFDKNRPDAVFVKDMFSALEVYNIAEKSGINIPNELLLIAIGSNYMVENLTSNLSLIKIPGFDIGAEAADLLYEQISNPLAEVKSSIVPVNFILKSSSIRLSNV